MLGLFSKSKKYPKVEISVSSRSIAQVVLVLLGFYFILSAINKAAHAITLIVVAFFLTLALNGPVHWLAGRLPGKKRGSRGMAIGISFLIIILILAGFIASITPPLIRQTNNFIDAAPGLVDDLRDSNTSLGSFVQKHNLENQVDKFSDQLSQRLDQIGGSLFGTLSKITSSIFSMLAIIVMTVMMLIEGPRWLSLVRRFIPKEKRAHADKLASGMYRVVAGYVNVQVFLAALAAIFIFFPLLLLGVDYPVALLVVVFICGLIPMVGHTIGAIIVSLVALLDSTSAGIIVFLLYVTYQQIENYVLQPRIQANATNMSPLLVFTAVLIGVTLNGLLGGLLAIPIAGCLRILVLDYVERRNLLEPFEAKVDTK